MHTLKWSWSSCYHLLFCSLFAPIRKWLSYIAISWIALQCLMNEHQNSLFSGHVGVKAAPTSKIRLMSPEQALLDAQKLLSTMTYSNASSTIDMIHEAMGQQVLTVDVSYPSSTILPKNKDCVASGLLPSADEYHESTSEDGQSRWCLHPYTMTSAVLIPKHVWKDSANHRHNNNDDTGHGDSTWIDFDDFIDTAFEFIRTALYYFIVIYVIFLSIALPYILYTQMRRCFLWFMGSNTNEGATDQSTRPASAAGAQRAVLPPPRIVAYRSIRTRRHYGGTENTRVNLSELSSDEEDNRPLGIRYTTRINHLSVSAPASASTQPLVASSPSPPLNEGHSGHEAHYRITNGHHPSENYTAQEEEETIKALDIEQNGLTNTVECPICYDPFVDSDIVMELGCRHTFHSGCIGQWLRRRHPTCPMCRAHIPTHGLDYRLLRMPSRYSNGFNALNYAEDPTYRLSRDYASHFVNHQMNDDPTNGERRPLLLDR